MNVLLSLAAVAEFVTGVALLAKPSLVTDLLLGTQVVGEGAAVARLAGLALIGLGVACGPLSRDSRALAGMLTYSTLAAIYLARLGIAEIWVGPLLWPAVALHAMIAGLMLRGVVIGGPRAGGGGRG